MKYKLFGILALIAFYGMAYVSVTRANQRAYHLKTFQGGVK